MEPLIGCRDKAVVINDVMSDNGHDVMKCFATFQKYIPNSIIIPSFMTIGSQMPELDWGAFFPPPPLI